MAKFEKKATFKMDFKKIQQELGYKPKNIFKKADDKYEINQKPKILYSGKGQGTL